MLLNVGKRPRSWNLGDVRAVVQINEGFDLKWI